MCALQKKQRIVGPIHTALDGDENASKNKINLATI